MDDNPFSGPQAVNPYDRPIPQGGQTAQATNQHGMAFDPTTKTGTPATQAFIDHMRPMIGQIAEQHAKDHGTLAVEALLDEAILPLAKRIKELEAALGIKQEQAAADLLDDAAQFTSKRGQPDLEAMAERHRIKMEKEIQR